MNGYDEMQINERITRIYALNDVINELLSLNHCDHPFTNQAISSIITEELYLNFLDHAGPSSFNPTSKGSAFMSIALQTQLDETRYSHEQIQFLKEKNFASECLRETKAFFYDSLRNEWFNRPFIQFSFLDFGEGIPATLQAQYLATVKPDAKPTDDSIIDYAFEHDSSRSVISNDGLERSIPRGLFDTLTIVKRYKGLLVVRSAYGKILYDFTTTADKKMAIQKFGKKQYFPGTLISIYIPAVTDAKLISTSVIKPSIAYAPVREAKVRFLNFASILRRVESTKSRMYNSLLLEIRRAISVPGSRTLTFLICKGSEHLDQRLIKKAIFILLSDYTINAQNNVIILDAGPDWLLDEISNEIISLNQAIRNYKIHPLPLVNFDFKTNKPSVRWLGVYDEEDRLKLNDLLHDEISIAKSDFNDPDNVIGHINEFDQYGNLKSILPTRTEMLEQYRAAIASMYKNDIDDILRDFSCVKIAPKGSFFLTPGNYYQSEFIDLTNAVNDKNACKVMAQHLLRAIDSRISNLESLRFLTVSSVGAKLLRAMKGEGLGEGGVALSFDNWTDFEEQHDKDDRLRNGTFVIICDVLATGWLTRKVHTKLREFGSELALIAVIVSSFDSNSPDSNDFLEKYNHKLIALYDHPVRKFALDDLQKDLVKAPVIRINPFTNIPVTLSLEATNYQSSVLFPTSIRFDETRDEIHFDNRIIDLISDEHLNVGFLEFNRVVHPYFFKTNKILDIIDEQFLKEIFRKINKPKLQDATVQLFFPRKSGVQFVDFQKIRNALNNHSIEEIELERINTMEGWRFPHSIDYLNLKVKDNVCILLDDGSCSGDTLIQMVDEIALNHPKEIIVLCFIGRVHDHKREFFSRISQITTQAAVNVPIAIYFVSHWHIPTYYIDDNPNAKEIRWLKDVAAIQNTPQAIVKIARSVSKQIETQPLRGFKDYKYLPLDKKKKSIPKKELLLLREEVGKIISFRLYRESFVFFDLFMKKYGTKKTTPDRYKEIELLCATFILEPYLYDKVAKVVPDVVGKIEQFVRALIFGDQNIYEKLTYQWSKKDIVHLFFIVFKNEKLVSELTVENFKRLIIFTQKVDSTVNYILYRLLRYFPIRSSQFYEMRFDAKIRQVLEHLKAIDDPEIPTKEIKKFYNFIKSLPSRNDYASQLKKIQENYLLEKEKEFHDEKKSFNHNISRIIISLREVIKNLDDEGVMDAEVLTTMRQSWFKIQEFINPILAFDASHRGFFAPYIRYELSHKIDRLREMVGTIEDILYKSNNELIEREKLEMLNRYVVTIQEDVQINSVLHNVIENSTCDLLHDFINPLENELVDMSAGLRVEDRLKRRSEKFQANIPVRYVEKLLVMEIATNLRKYSDGNVTLKYSVTNDGCIEVEIINHIAQASNRISNGEGLKCIELLAEFKPFGFTYKKQPVDHSFKQTLTFNIFSNGPVKD
ncbi:MAG TPA: hypothetical protein VGD40_23145 [Chryseosolibacter sp.]